MKVKLNFTLMKLNVIKFVMTFNATARVTIKKLQ